MKLKNKKTGEIVYATMMASYGGGELQIRYYPVDNAEGTQFKEYRSISELNAEWEDYEEPKDFWYIDDFMIMCGTEGEFTTPDLASFTKKDIEKLKAIGNYFETKEEAEKAVEKLKAWKRLKSCRFKFKGWRTADLGADKYYFVITAESDGAGKGDLDLLFGGEE